MSIRNRRIFARPARAILVIGLTAFGLALPASQASAEGLFDLLFGALRRATSTANSFADPNAPATRPEGQGYETGSGVAYCVRLCDGRYFPIQRVSGANPAQVCSSFCPAAHTKIYSGGGVINHATAQDGTRYADLPSAFAYRDKVVPGCSCNGKDAYGLVTPRSEQDPTLRAGDIVATEHGFVAYNGGRYADSEFTPIDAYGGLSGEQRQRLAGTRIIPRNVAPAPEPAITSSVDDRRVQLGR